VHSPAGLPLGARTAPEIALSILSEIVAERARRRPDIPAPPATAVDPVCGMTVAAVDASPHLEVDGERIWFCGEGCRRAHRAA
jgi:xanthine dehydrogenase accessory factor